MLETVTLSFTECDDITLDAKGITVFVGPNNSGKSLVLRELEHAFIVHPFPANLRILKDYEVHWPTPEELVVAIEGNSGATVPGMPIDHVGVSRINPIGSVETSRVQISSLLEIVRERREKNWFATQYLRYGMLRLDGRSRFSLTDDREAGDILGQPSNILAHLFQNDQARDKVRALVKDAFGVYFVIDPTNLGQLRIRLSRQKPLEDEQSLNSSARAFHRSALHIKDASDGVQAFTGIITAVLSGEYHTLLIDEPEAFLHPPLARKLGKHLSALAAERGGSLMASTHSADFLMGCIQGGANVKVVRLEYSEGKSKGRIIDPSALTDFFSKPLMRSANIVSGLFYDGVVVCESDNDRAFYGEIYHRLSAENPEFPSLLFVNAQNKQTIRDMIGPLRKFGVPAAAIVDIDFVKDGGKNTTDWLNAAQVPRASHSSLGASRSTIDTCLKETGKNMKTDGGVSVLGKSDRMAADHYFDQLENWGIFIVRCGEVENWLQELNVEGKKTDWAVNMLNRLGSDPIDPTYVRPRTGDVWDFLRKIVAWIKDPARKGTN